MTHQVYKLFLFAALLLNFQTTFAQTIDKIEVTGNHVFSESNYLEWINTASIQYSASLSDTIKNRIAKKLRESGYYNFYFQKFNESISADSQSVNISIQITEGEPTYINKIITESIDSLDIEIAANEFLFLEGSVLSVNEIESSFSELLDHFENNGFPFAAIKVESIFFFDDSLKEKHMADIYINFVKKQISTIDTIIIEGNSKTKDYVINRDIGISEGDVYSQDKIDEIPSKLNRLNFFEPVAKPAFYFNSENKGVLKINVKEVETNNFDGIIGYIPSSSDNAGGYLTGFVNISLRNLFGTGRAIAVRWNKFDRASQDLELKYLEPWIFSWPINVNLRLFQRQQDSTYVQRILNGSLEFLATESLTASLLFAQEYTIPTDPENRGFTVYNSSTFISGVNLKIDSRNDIFNPIKGIYFINSYMYSSKEILGPEKYISDSTNLSVNQFRFELDFVFYKQIFQRHVPSISLHIRELRGDDIEISDMYWFGGMNTLRGYPENQFVGNTLLWSNVEYRYLLGKRSYGFLFCDLGYYSRNKNINLNVPSISEFKIGYGVGITLETGLGVLGISYALGEGDTFNQGKIHFGLLGQF